MSWEQNSRVDLVVEEKNWENWNPDNHSDKQMDAQTLPNVFNLLALQPMKIKIEVSARHPHPGSLMVHP